MKHKVAVLGEGAWGTAVASVLAHNGHEVKLWCNDSQVAEAIATLHINKRYMPGIKLSDLIMPTISIQESLDDVSIVFEASPVKYLRSVLQQVKPFVNTNQRWILLSKGIERETLMLPLQIIKDVFKNRVEYFVCLGPSFADEVIRKKFTTVILAGKARERVAAMREVIENEYFRIYESTDMMGTQVGAALKNAVALGYGILEGAGYGENAKAFLVTKALQDMVALAQSLGGQLETIYGLSGLGDLILTCTGGMSRNVMVGTAFGEGQSLEKVIEEKDLTPEGVNTVQSINELAQKYMISLPVCQGIYEMVFQGKSVKQFLYDIA